MTSCHLDALARLVASCEARSERLATLAGVGLRARERPRLRELAVAYQELAAEIRRLAIEHELTGDLVSFARPERMTERAILEAVERVLESDLPVSFRRVICERYRQLHGSLQRRRPSSAIWAS